MLDPTKPSNLEAYNSCLCWTVVEDRRELVAETEMVVRVRDEGSGSKHSIAREEETLVPATGCGGYSRKY